MKFLLIALLVLSAPTLSQAGFFSSSEELEGVGYLAKADGTKVYVSSAGDAVSGTVKKDFPFVAFAGSEKWFGIMAAESIVNGRAQVRYWKNGVNEKDGENTAWVDLKDVARIQFDCCGDNAHCTGITAPVFKARTYTDCFKRAMEAGMKQGTAASGTPETSGNGAIELEKLKLQLEIEKLRLQKEVEKLKLEQEIEKLKLEQERLKAGLK